MTLVSAMTSAEVLAVDVWVVVNVVSTELVDVVVELVGTPDG